MIKNIIVLIGLIVLAGCETPYSDTDVETKTVVRYLTLGEYDRLLDSLESKTSITKAVINEELQVMGVSIDYDYSLYTSSRTAHGMKWKSYNSTIHDWNYYIDVDIWVNPNGTLNRNMCKYYQG